MPRILERIEQGFNEALISAETLGYDFAGKSIPQVTEQWILNAERLFQLLDPERLGIVDTERLLYFVLALIAGDLSRSYESSEDIHTIIKAELQNSLDEMDHFFGTVTKRDFKAFLLKKGLCTPKGVASIITEFNKIVTTAGSKPFRSLMCDRYPLLATSQQQFPPVFEQAFVLAIPGAVYLKQFLSDCCAGSVSTTEYLHSNRDSFVPMLNETETDTFALYEYLRLAMHKTCQQLGFTEGLHFKCPITNCANEMATRFSSTRPDMRLPKDEATGIVYHFLQYYDLLLSEVIDAVMRFYQQEGCGQRVRVYESSLQGAVSGKTVADVNQSIPRPEPEERDETEEGTSGDPGAGHGGQRDCGQERS